MPEPEARVVIETDLSDVLGDRLNWLMDHRGVSPTELSRRSGVSVQYINNLVHGHKTNPAHSKVKLLAECLDTTMAFLSGETNDPEVWNAREQVPVAFWQHLRDCEATQERVSRMSVEERFYHLVEFIRARFPQRFATLELAYQMGLSLQGFNDLLSGKHELTRFPLEMITQITGIEMTFFMTGEVPAPGKRSIQEK